MKFEGLEILIIKNGSEANLERLLNLCRKGFGCCRLKCDVFYLDFKISRVISKKTAPF